ncbi:MAG: class I SAM-dependent methyltransferase, partial [Verrucomicrobiota bacterium]
FNGLMQIPDRSMRRKAMSEIERTLTQGGVFIFTTLDRESPLYREVFLDRDDPEHCVETNEGVLEFGDRHFDHEHGTTFMHVPVTTEVEEDLAIAGFELVASVMRSEICPESDEVEDFSEDCRFWIAKKPAG